MLYIQEEYSDWDNYRDGQRDCYGSDGKRITRATDANRGKISRVHTIRSFITGNLISYTDDWFEKMHRNNQKNKRHNLIRKLRQSSPRHK